MRLGADLVNVRTMHIPGGSLFLLARQDAGWPSTETNQPQGNAQERGALGSETGACDWRRAEEMAHYRGVTLPAGGTGDPSSLDWTSAVRTNQLERNTSAARKGTC